MSKFPEKIRFRAGNPGDRGRQPAGESIRKASSGPPGAKGGVGNQTRIGELEASKECILMSWYQKPGICILYTISALRDACVSWETTGNRSAGSGMHPIYKRVCRGGIRWSEEILSVEGSRFLPCS